MEKSSNNLPQAKQDKLRKLLDDDAMLTLFEVLESGAFEYEVEATNNALQGTTGYDNRARDCIEKARSLHGIIALLKQMRAQPDSTPFKVSSAKPNTPNTKPAT